MHRGYHYYAWKTSKGVLLHTLNKVDYNQVKSNTVISLLDYLGKITEKLVAELISNLCESSGVLHQGQMWCQKQCSCVYAIARVMNKVEEIWNNDNVATLLLLDVKGAFDHVCFINHFQRLKEMKEDRKLIEWVESFLSDRRLQFVIDGHCGNEIKIQSGVPQKSPMSSVRFAIFLSEVFDFVEKSTNGFSVTSFVDDCGSLFEATYIPEPFKLLLEAGNLAIGWELDNFLQFDKRKTEVIAFT